METWGAAVSVAGALVFQLLWVMMFFLLLSWRWLTSPLPGMAKGIWLQMCTSCGYGVFTHNYVCLCCALPRTHSDLTLMFAHVLTDSLSAQRARTHGRRVRHSSSDSTGSDCSIESSSSSLQSRSPSQSPEVHSDPLSPANVQLPCTNTKEVSVLL